MRPGQVWTTPHCNDQAEPRPVVRQMRFVAGNATGESTDGGGGGAIFARGGRLAIIDSEFVGNRCDRTGPDVGGGAVRVLDQHRDRPVVVRRSVFRDGRCSNGSALSSIGVSWRVTASTFTGNRATGRGANPARALTLRGGARSPLERCVSHVLLRRKVAPAPLGGRDSQWRCVSHVLEHWNVACSPLGDDCGAPHRLHR